MYNKGVRKLSKNQLSLTSNVLGTERLVILAGSFRVSDLYTCEYVPSGFLTVAEDSLIPAKAFILLSILCISPLRYP